MTDARVRGTRAVWCGMDPHPRVQYFLHLRNTGVVSSHLHTGDEPESDLLVVGGEYKTKVV